MAAQDAPYGQPQSFDRTVHFYGLDGVGGTGGVEAAAGRIQRRDAALVEPDGQNENPLSESHAASPEGSEART